MKKMLAAILATILLVTFAASAFAELYPTFSGQSAYMDIVVSCTDTTTYTNGRRWTEKTCGADNHAIYVRHYVDAGYGEYTNHYRGREVDKETGNTIANRGAKWCTVGINVPIQSNNITMWQCYSVSARGNTNHYDYDGVRSLVLKTNMYVNMDDKP